MSNIVRDFLDFLKRCGHSFSRFVQWFFRTLGFRTKTRIAFSKIREETVEHIDHLRQMLMFFVLPMAICYVGLGFFLGKNVFDSLCFSILLFVYSSFLPDLLRLFRTKDHKEKRELEKW